MKDVTEGIFVLTRTIQNPESDRRSSYSWMQERRAWDAGWKFVIRRDHTMEAELRDRRGRYLTEGVKCYQISRIGIGSGAGNTIMFQVSSDGVRFVYPVSRDTAKAYTELLESLVPSTDPFDAYHWLFVRTNRTLGSAHDALWRLYRSGKVSADDISAALKEADTEDDIGSCEFQEG